MSRTSFDGYRTIAMSRVFAPSGTSSLVTVGLQALQVGVETGEASLPEVLIVGGPVHDVFESRDASPRTRRPRHWSTAQAPASTV